MLPAPTHHTGVRGAPVPDVLVLGAGMAGLTVAALLARAGQRVQVLDAHHVAGGNAHTFCTGDYRFCGQIHPIFGVEPGGPVRTLLDTLGLADEVPLLPLDPDGYDHVVIAGERHRIPTGLARHRDRLVDRFPDERDALYAYFRVVAAVRDELDHLPDPIGPADILGAPATLPNLLRWRNATLSEVFDRFHLSRRARAFLAGQAGDHLLPPGRVSFLVHVAVASGYARGAWYPAHHHGSLVDHLVALIESHRGCAVTLGVEVDTIHVERDRVAWVHSTDGRVWTGRTVISNIDPARTAALIGAQNVPASWLRLLRYEYSCGTYTLYLGLRDVDLSAHGFGNWNIRRYAHDDLDQIHAGQVDRGDLSDPWLFLSTPTLHSRAPGLAPPGHEVLVASTACAYAAPAGLAADGDAASARTEARLRERILDILDAEYLPGLRDHIDVDAATTPVTAARCLRAPLGNALGAALTPAHVGLARVPFETPFNNLYLANATAGYPSVAGTIRAGQRLFARLASTLS